MTANAITPHTRIDNSLIDNLPAQIGIYGLGIYVAIKRYLNTKTGDCYPSYQTIAKKLHIDRGTVIRYVKKMKDLNIISPEWRFKEDGSHTSNQYNFSEAEKKSGGTKPPTPSSPEPPKQSEKKKKERTITDVDLSADRQDFYQNHILPLIPTQKQQECSHPASEIVHLSDNITICNHCYGFLEEETPCVEIVMA